VRKTEIDKLPAEVDPIPAWTFDAEHEKQHAQWAWNTNQESLAWCLDGLISEVMRLRAVVTAVQNYRQAAADAGHPMLPWPALDITLDALGSAKDG
jgi:hypothetical protein